jgi:RNA-dependent RNA polymerase
LGDFSQEKNILKRYARRGQCFSTSKFILDLKPNEVAYSEDIVRNGYTFTDGCGQISVALAMEVAKSYNYS